MQSRGSVDVAPLVNQMCEHSLWSIKLSWIIPVLQCQRDLKCLRVGLSYTTSYLHSAPTLVFWRGMFCGGGGAVVICYRCSLSLSLLGHSPLHMQNMSCCPPTPAQFAAVTHFFFISAWQWHLCSFALCNCEASGKAVSPFFPPPSPLSFFVSWQKY